MEREAAKKAEEERKKQEEQKEREAAKAAAEAEEAAKIAFAKKQEEEMQRRKKEAEKEAEKNKKRGRGESEEESEEERTSESSLFDKGVVWRKKEGRVCEECRKGKRKCHWPDASTRARACHYCSGQKSRCVELEQGQSEAGPSTKKRKVDKGKTKEKSEPELGGDAVAALTAEIRGLREELRELSSIGRATYRLFKNMDANVGFMADQLDPKLNEKGAEEDVGEAGKTPGKTPEEAPEDASEEMPEETLQ